MNDDNDGIDHALRMSGISLWNEPQIYGRKVDSSFMILFYSAINSTVLYALATSDFPFFCIYKTKE